MQFVVLYHYCVGELCAQWFPVHKMEDHLKECTAECPECSKKLAGIYLNNNISAT